MAGVYHLQNWHYAVSLNLPIAISTFPTLIQKSLVTYEKNKFFFGLQIFLETHARVRLFAHAARLKSEINYSAPTPPPLLLH